MRDLCTASHARALNPLRVIRPMVIPLNADTISGSIEVIEFVIEALKHRFGTTSPRILSSYAVSVLCPFRGAEPTLFPEVVLTCGFLGQIISAQY